MRSGKIFAALAVSLALLTGCGPKHPAVAAASPPAEAPSLPPQRMASLISPVPPPFPTTAKLIVKLDTTAPPEVRTEVAASEPRHTPKHHAKLAQDTTAEKNSVSSLSPSETTQVATAQPPESSKIGQLSAANPDSNAADRHSLSGKIDAVENGLNGIKRPLSSDEQKTAGLIRSYITRARDALKSDDIDGATILSNKASQLLEELTKQ